MTNAFRRVMTKRYEWIKSYEFETVAVTFEPLNSTRPPICPMCKKPTDERYGQIDEDEWGNAIHATNWVCYDCRIESKYD